MQSGGRPRGAAAERFTARTKSHVCSIPEPIGTRVVYIHFRKGQKMTCCLAFNRHQRLKHMGRLAIGIPHELPEVCQRNPRKPIPKLYRCRLCFLDAIMAYPPKGSNSFYGMQIFQIGIFIGTLAKKETIVGYYRRLINPIILANMAWRAAFIAFCSVKQEMDFRTKRSIPKVCKRLREYGNECELTFQVNVRQRTLAHQRNIKTACISTGGFSWNVAMIYSPGSLPAKYRRRAGHSR